LVSLKERKVINILKTYLGLGDVLFFLVLTLAFSPINFVVFYLGSMLLTTIIYAGIILFNKNKKTLIPLAGAMSLLLIVTLLVEQTTTSFQFFQDIFQLV
jgi:cellulose synthase/poly-beta-1,6-N-acetylglucosamine synthase-like glycosyltransferase